MKLSLVVLTPGKQEGKAIPITLAQFIIGRDPQCQLRPASPAISKRHCAVLVKNGKVFIRDFDSTNGTFVNDEPVKGERELKNGDTLKAGPLLFEVRMEATVPVTPKPAAPAPAAKEAVTAKQPAAKTVPPPKPAAVAAGGGEDDDIAAMLLSLQDDDSSSGSGEVPEGSTVMELALPKELQAGEGTATNKADGTGGTPDKMAAAKKDQASTSSAAKAILEKMMKRPR